MQQILEPNVITVGYEELDGPTGTINQYGLSAIRKYKCAWNQWGLLAQQLLGWCEIRGVFLIIHLPHPDPHLPYCFAKDIKFAGFGSLVESPQSIKIAEYNYAVLTVEYGTPEYDEQPIDPSNPLITETWEGATEFITHNYDNLYWDSGAAELIKAGDAPAQIIKMTEWSYTIHRLIYMPTGFYDIVGKINNTSVTTLRDKITFPAGTLLCGDPSLRRETTVGGVITESVTFRFMYRNNGTFASPMGWNWFPKPSAAGTSMSFSRIYDAGGNPKDFYKPADFSGLILT